jgi:MFS family permease
VRDVGLQAADDDTVWAYAAEHGFVIVSKDADFFTASSFLSGIAPNIEFLVLMRILQGLGGGPVIPMAQAIMWEIFPLKERGTALAVWGIGIMLPRSSGRPRAAGSPTTGPGAGSSTSTSRSAPSPSSW